MNELIKILTEIKEKAEAMADVEFYDQGDARSQFQDVADMADTALIKLDEETAAAFKAFLNEKQSIDDGKTIVIKWGIEDILSRAEDLKVELTEEQAISALGSVKNHHDCNYGITWDHLDVAIDDVIRGEI